MPRDRIFRPQELRILVRRFLGFDAPQPGTAATNAENASLSISSQSKRYLIVRPVGRHELPDVHFGYLARNRFIQRIRRIRKNPRLNFHRRCDETNAGEKKSAWRSWPATRPLKAPAATQPTTGAMWQRRSGIADTARLNGDDRPRSRSRIAQIVPDHSANSAEPSIGPRDSQHAFE